MSAGRRVARLVVALLLEVAALPAFATTYRLMSPSEVLLAADLVFYGTVTDVVTQDRAGETWSVVTLRVDELLKGFGYDPAVDGGVGGSAGGNAGGSAGELPGPPDAGAVAPETVTLEFLGGTAAGSELLVSGAPSWRFDDSYLVAAYEQQDLASPLVGFRQGLWLLAEEGLVDLDGTWLAVGADGSPVRAPLDAPAGATTSQVIRAVQGVVSGTLTPAQQTPSAEESAPSEAEAPSADEQAGDAGGDASGEAPGEPGPGPGGEPPAAPAEPSSDVAGADEPGTEQVAAAPETVPTVEVDYAVDDSGGPLLLSEMAERAAAAWRSAVVGTVDLRLAASADSGNVVRYGSLALLGPDTVSLTTVAPDGRVTAYLSPTAGELTHTALVHELGVLLGLREGGSGVMATALTSPLDSPTPEDVVELSALSRFEPADLTRDGTVDFYDLIALAEAFGETGVNVPGDLNGDGSVDDADVEVLRQRYQFAPPALPPAADP